jgi:hypothetical protein
MELDRYELRAKRGYKIFEFTSKGPKGNITKRVRFDPIHIKNFHNLALSDVNTNTGYTNDKAISNNGDTKKVLATVAMAVYRFLDKYPDFWVYAKGNDKARTRLYRMAISNNSNMIPGYFEILGLTNNRWLDFEKGIDYKAFLLHRKLN